MQDLTLDSSEGFTFEEEELSTKQKVAIGFKKALFGVSCLFWVPLGIAIGLAVLPFNIIFSCAATFKTGNVKKGFLYPLFAIACTFAFPVAAAIDYGNTIGTKHSTDTTFSDILFSSISILVSAVSSLFISSKSAETPKDNTPAPAPQQTGENETDNTKDKEKEQGKTNKETKVTINEATNKAKEQNGEKPDATEQIPEEQNKGE